MVTDTVERLSATGTKKAALRGVSRPPEPAGARGEGREAEGVSSVTAALPGALPEALAHLPLTDVTISELNLEEIFRHYYEGEAEQ